jgi:hypothetical protein
MVMEESMTNLFNKLRTISNKANEKVNNINYGGCAVMAALVGKELEKLGIEVEGIVPHGNPTKARSNVEKPHVADAFEWENNGINFNHVALRFKVGSRVYTYDTDKLSRGSSRFGENLRYKTSCKFGEGFKVRELQKIANTGDGYWNQDFNRKDIPKLRKIVKEVFTNE